MTPDDIRAIRERHAKLIASVENDPTIYSLPIVGLAAELRAGNPEAFQAPASPEWLENNERHHQSQLAAEAATAGRFAASQSVYVAQTNAMLAQSKQNTWYTVAAILAGAVIIAAALALGGA